MGVQLVARDAGLDAAVHVGLADVEDAVHARQVERDAAAHRGDVALERGAGAPGHDGDVFGVAERQQAAGFVGGFDEGDGVGQHRRLGVLAVRVVVAQRRVGGDAIAEEVAAAAMRASTGMDGFLVAGCRRIGPGAASWQGSSEVSPVAVAVHRAGNGPGRVIASTD